MRNTRSKFCQVKCQGDRRSSSQKPCYKLLQGLHVFVFDTLCSVLAPYLYATQAKMSWFGGQSLLVPRWQFRFRNWRWEVFKFQFLFEFCLVKEMYKSGLEAPCICHCYWWNLDWLVYITVFGHAYWNDQCFVNIAHYLLERVMRRTVIDVQTS